MRSFKTKHNKYCRKIKLPPDAFNRNYEFPRGWSNKTKQWVRIAFNSNESSTSRKQISYFCIILLRKVQNKWRQVVVFDTYHKGKIFVHGHRVIGVTGKRELIGDVPTFNNLQEGILWVYKHLDKNWHKYITTFLNDLKRR